MDTRQLIGLMIAAVAASGCFCTGFFDDAEEQLKPPATEAAKPAPLCQGFKLPKATFEPLERVELDVQLRDDLAQLMPPIAAQVIYEGSDEPLWAHVMVAGEEGQERYVLIIPPSARIWEPSSARVTLEVLLDEGEAVRTCEAEGMISIAGLKQAPGTLSAMLPRSRRLMELQAQRLGLTLDEIISADPRTLPAAAQPIVMAHHLLEGADHPNSLAKIAAGQAEAQASFAQGLPLAEALLAAAKVPEDLDATIAMYESLDPAPPLEFEAPQPLSWRPNRIEDPCKALRQLKVQTPEQLSNYMREGERFRRWAGELRNPYDNKGAGYAAITGIGQVPLVGDAVSLLPLVGQALTVSASVITVDLLYREFVANTYPSQLFAPAVDVSRDRFEEDSDEVALWTRYEVSAQSKGGDMTKIVEAILSGGVELMVSFIPVGKLIEEVAPDGKTIIYEPIPL